MIRTIAKHRYFKGRNAKRSLKQYVNYVSHRAGVDKTPGGRLFFDRDSDSIPCTQVQHAIGELNPSGIVAHELILSPGIQSVDQETYTRELMNKLSRSKGQELEWFASSHNSAHNHIHVLIKGRDARGGYVRFGKEDYRRLRDWGDLYLERNHELERYLHKSVDLDKEFERDHGDELFESLFRVGSGGHLESSVHAPGDKQQNFADLLYPQEQHSDDLLSSFDETLNRQPDKEKPHKEIRETEQTKLFEDEENDKEKLDDGKYK